MVQIKPVTADIVVPLRYALLRPDEPYAHSQYPGDDAPDTIHFGLYLVDISDQAVGSASVIHEPLPGESDPSHWRMRGVTVMPHLRSGGYGKLLVERCLDYAAAQGASLLWFYSSQMAIPFYLHLGFSIREHAADPADPAHPLILKRLEAPM